MGPAAETMQALFMDTPYVLKARLDPINPNNSPLYYHPIKLRVVAPKLELPVPPTTKSIHKMLGPLKEINMRTPVVYDGRSWTFHFQFLDATEVADSLGDLSASIKWADDTIYDISIYLNSRFLRKASTLLGDPFGDGALAYAPLMPRTTQVTLRTLSPSMWKLSLDAHYSPETHTRVSQFIRNQETPLFNRDPF